jgi:anti-sigma B factor antagonist
MAPGQRYRIEVDHGSAGARVTIAGEIDMATIPPLERARERVLAQNPTQVVIDLRDVRFIDSSGLKFLLETDRLSRRNGWTLQLVRPAETAMRVLTLTGVDKHLPFIDGGEHQRS